MSYYDYQESKHLARNDPSFSAIIMAAMRKADTNNLYVLRHAWPDTWRELDERYHAAGGFLGDEKDIYTD